MFSRVDFDWHDDTQTELCHDDDGFVYRRKRRRPSDHEQPQLSASATALTDLEQERRLWRRNKLLKLKDEYANEIRYWEFLSDSLRKMEEERPAPVGEGAVAVSDGAVLGDFEGSGSDACRVVDELLVKVEQQEAMISHVTNLCNVAEAVCCELEEERNREFFDLSVWESSPRKLMSFLCN